MRPPSSPWSTGADLRGRPGAAVRGGGSLRAHPALRLLRAAAAWLGLSGVLYNDPGVSRCFPELCEPLEEMTEPEGVGTPVQPVGQSTGDSLVWASASEGALSPAGPAAALGGDRRQRGRWERGGPGAEEVATPASRPQRRLSDSGGPSSKALAGTVLPPGHLPPGFPVTTPSPAPLCSAQKSPPPGGQPSPFYLNVTLQAPPTSCALFCILLAPASPKGACTQPRATRSSDRGIAESVTALPAPDLGFLASRTESRVSCGPQQFPE
ncbi:nascent polypeptide-associated complex subunit alpha, muscle-specific form-like [Myotis myotis]|uniref:nascent polypeptide-associated complex subunit alpha, muscle-specific form-like n=1 Tax=Myotis myotis TaxID=51298 RepID=UPI00174899BD|nr:nascent polypeptide-associated complex subunit alpha, muscle-specific form-like [Myotis myotis]